MDESAKSRFEKAADTLGVDPATKETMWRRIGDLQLSPDDPTVVFLAVAGVLEKAAQDIPAAVAAFPQQVREAAQQSIEPVTTAAIAATREKITAELAKTVEETKGEVRRAAAMALRELCSREESRARFLTIAGLCLIAALAGGFGYGAGRGNEADIQRGSEALALRADAESWLTLMRANTDLTRTLRENCGVGGKGAYLVQGVRACAAPLWLDGPPGAPGNAIGRGITVLSWIGGLSTTAWSVFGVAVGFFMRKIIVEFGRRRSVRWLLDL